MFALTRLYCVDPAGTGTIKTIRIIKDILDNIWNA